MKKPAVLVFAALILAAAASLSASATPGGGSSVAATPGVSKKTITIGGTFPLSGVASIYAPIPRGMEA